MSFGDDKELVSFVYDDPRMSHITAGALQAALKPFPLDLCEDKDWEWLALVVRRSLALTFPNRRDGPDRDGNKEIREELLRLSKVAGDTWLQLFGRSESVDDRIYGFALSRWDGVGGVEVEDGLFLGNPAEFVRFQSAIAEINWVSSFMRDGACSVPSQGGQWRESDKKRRRIDRACVLAPIFEAAFGKAITANNFPNEARHPQATPFMLFYKGVVTLAFGSREATNYTEVVKAARALHRKAPMELSPEVFPGLGGAL